MKGFYMATQNLPATQKAANIRALLEKSKGQMAMALPKHLTVDRLLRVAMTSIQKTPKLLDCTQQSLLACIMTCAQLGLEPDQFLGQAYLVPYGNVCTLIPGYRGYIALARRSGEVQTVSSQVVYEGDEFHLEYGIQDTLKHIPAFNGSRGKPIGAYVVFKYKDGSYSFDFMSVQDIEKIRTRSKASKDGPWVTDWDEMAKKTVIKRHIKLAPLSVEFARAVALEDRAMMGESQADLLGIEESDDGNIIDADEDQSSEDISAEFNKTIPAGTDIVVLNEFISATAKRNNAAIDAVKTEALKNPTDFWKIFNAYVRTRQQKNSNGKQQKETIHTEDLAPSECPDHPGNIYTASYCGACAKRQDCPAWA
jgi:recombination protein RecT